jgi:hypothetical protein
VIDARVFAHWVVEQVPLGHDAGHGGLRSMISPWWKTRSGGSEEVIPDNRNFAGLSLSMGRGGERLSLDIKKVETEHPSP